MNLLGQTRALNAIASAQNAGRLAHAYLFVGAESIGKAAAAKLLARHGVCAAANRRALPSGAPCGPSSDDSARPLCANCDRLLRGIHPDYLELAPEGAGGQITTDAVEKVLARLTRSPHEANVRTIVIRDCDRMNAISANQILKTLEEPPPQNRFILTTARPDRVLRTIRSRCHRIPFAPLQHETIAAICQRECGCSAELANQAAVLARGNVSVAIAFAAGDGGVRIGELQNALRELEKSPAAEVISAVERIKREHERDEIASALIAWADSVRQEANAQALLGQRGHSSAHMRAILRSAAAIEGSAPVDLVLESLLLKSDRWKVTQ